MSYLIQTRSEQYGLKFWSTLAEADLAARKDKSIWKMSWDDPDGSRVRMVRQRDGSWKEEPLMETVNSLLQRDFGD